MESRYIEGFTKPDYDDQITQALEEECKGGLMDSGFNDYLMGIENRNGIVYRVLGISLNEGVGLTNRLYDLGLRDQVGELEGSSCGYHFLMGYFGEE